MMNEKGFAGYKALKNSKIPFRAYDWHSSASCSKKTFNDYELKKLTAAKNFQKLFVMLLSKKAAYSEAKM